MVSIKGFLAWPCECERGRLRAGVGQLVEELLISRQGVASQRGDRINHFIQPSSFASQQGGEGQIESLRIIRSNLAVERECEIGLFCEESEVSQFLAFGADGKV